jgi:hypothetical protein
LKNEETFPLSAAANGKENTKYDNDKDNQDNANNEHFELCAVGPLLRGDG